MSGIVSLTRGTVLSRFKACLAIVVGLESLLANLPLLGVFTKGHCQATKDPFISTFLIHPSFLLCYLLLTITDNLMPALAFSSTYSLPSYSMHQSCNKLHLLCSLSLCVDSFNINLKDRDWHFQFPFISYLLIT